MSIAIIKTGGKQYKIQEGSTIKVEKLPQKVDEPIEFQDLLSGRAVSAKVLTHGKHEKIRITKFRRKTGYKRVTGHRQMFTELKIEAIK